MVSRRIRIDRLIAPIVIVADLASAMPTLDRTPARLTSEGYLEADALLARDGLLVYSDGSGASWNELRPRAELERAAASWANAPITDDHPPGMVTADTHREHQRGVVLGTPTVVEIDGVAYLRARISIRDAELVRKVLDGLHQLSIGFRALVDETEGTHNGARYDAVQTELEGNHVAVVERGRAGPACRVMLDSARVACHTPGATMLATALAALNAALKGRKDHVVALARKAHGLALKADKAADAKVGVKLDEVGMPTTMAKIVGPDGTEIEVPTWVAALIAEALEEREAAGLASPADPEVEGAAAPAAPADAGVTPVAPKPEDEKKMTPDKIAALVRNRSRLARLADKAGVSSARIDTASDTELAREYIAKAAPHLKADADKAEGAALDALVRATELAPVLLANPFEVRLKVDAANVDPEVEALARSYMQ